MAYFMEKHAADRHVARPLQPTEVFWTYRSRSIHDDFDPRAITSPTWVISSQNNPCSVSPLPSNLPRVGGCRIGQYNRRKAARYALPKGTIATALPSGEPNVAVSTRYSPRGTATIDSVSLSSCPSTASGAPTVKRTQPHPRRSSAEAALGLPPFSKTSIDL